MSSASNLDACPLESLEVLENPLVAGDGPISSEPASDQQLQQQQQQLQQIATSGRRISSRLSERGPRPVFYDYSDDEFEDDEVFQKSPKSFVPPFFPSPKTSIASFAGRDLQFHRCN
jgi:hypothetical protein